MFCTIFNKGMNYVDVFIFNSTFNTKSTAVNLKNAKLIRKVICISNQNNSE